MIPQRIMLIAGEASGDALASELVKALRSQLTNRPEMFGVGGPQMAKEGVEVVIDMTAHSVIGLIEVVKKYAWFKKVFEQLKQLAIERKPDLIICVDFSGFNRRFAHAIREFTRSLANSSNWQPKIVQFVSPQVWASRPGRADKMAPDLDLLLCLFPFEKAWYAARTPQLRVEFVGHPIFDRHRTSETAHITSNVSILLLPGSRAGELKRHLPVMIEAAKQIGAQYKNVRFEMVLPNETLAKQARVLGADDIPNLTTRIGDLSESLARSTVAIASTGTVTLECAYFGVPTIAMYKTSWSTYQIGRRIIQVKFLAMPNLLANESIFPEFIQNEATGDNLAREALDLLKNQSRREMIQSKLSRVVASLGGPGASERAAKAVLALP
jgi:lipid-A-disaccharide synthase